MALNFSHLKRLNSFIVSLFLPVFTLGCSLDKEPTFAAESSVLEMAAVATPVTLTGVVSITPLMWFAISNVAEASGIIPSGLPYLDRLPISNPTSPEENPVSNQRVNPLIGTWKAKTIDGKPLESNTYSDYECPDIVLTIFYVHNYTLIFNENILVEVVEKQTKDLNRSINLKTCVITRDDPDEIKPREVSRDTLFNNLLYTFNDNKVSLLPKDPDDPELELEFLNENKDQFVIVGDPGRTIFEKQ